MTTHDWIVIGGGAAGFFGAIAAAEARPGLRVLLLEKTMQPLAKVRISGGGRCNVTHACFDPAELVRNYPRGHKELRGPFSRFQTRDTIAWFEARGVPLKMEADGRMFPVTDSSQTIIDCLQNEAKRLEIEVHLGEAIESLAPGFQVGPYSAPRILLATGSNKKGLEWAANLGHTIVPQVPSLFTFNAPSSPLLELAGIATEATVTLPTLKLQQRGPVLLTHWGFSGPAVLKLSAWGARLLHACDYILDFEIDWGGGPLPKRLDKALREMAGLQEGKPLSKVEQRRWKQTLHHCRFRMEGKTTYKSEFVTCGGVSLKEIDFKTMQSKICPGLYFAGEILDIDGITGGFNFQNAWTTAWIAGHG